MAMAFQEAVFLAAAPERRRDLLARVLGKPFGGSLDDPIGVQDGIRTGLMKAGGPAFVPESPVSFRDAIRVILGLGGIPCYPTLADGASPICPWEEPPAELAERLQASGIFVAELIPGRNRPEVVDAYVSAFRESGIIVMAGTEHNTRARIPLEPRCVDGTLPSPAARAAFWEATCVVAAHQHLRAAGEPGYVDGEGRLNPRLPRRRLPGPLVRRDGRRADRRRVQRGGPMSALQSGRRELPPRPVATLDALIEVARRYGRDPEFSRGGGGNASAKVDGVLYIKPSGVALATLTADELVALDMEPLLEMLRSGDAPPDADGSVRGPGHARRDGGAAG